MTELFAAKDANGVDNHLRVIQIGKTDNFIHIGADFGGTPRVSAADRRRLIQVLESTLPENQKEVQPLTTEQPFKVGDKVRAVRLMIPVEKDAVGEVVEITDHAVWPYQVHFPKFDHTGSYTEEEIELTEHELTVGDRVKVADNAYERGGEYGDIIPKPANRAGVFEFYVQFEDGDIVGYYGDVLEWAGLRFNEVFQQEPKFKVGDRIRVVKDNDDEGEVSIGDEGRVTYVYETGDYDYQVELDNHWGWFYADEDEIELIEDEEDEEEDENPGYTLGQRVRLVTNYAEIPAGTEGTVTKLNPDHLYVDFDFHPKQEPLFTWFYEIEAVPAADTAAEAVKEAPAPLTLGELLEKALERTTAAADAVNAGPETFIVPTGAVELRQGLGTLVAAILMQPNHEEILRALVGER